MVFKGSRWVREAVAVLTVLAVVLSLSPAASLADESLPTQSTYELTYTGLADSYTAGTLVTVGGNQQDINQAVAAAVQGLNPIQVTVATAVYGAAGYDAVRIQPINAGDHIQLWAKDAANNWYDINKVGWGPAEGFPLPAQYTATTDVYVLADVADDYPVTVKLVDVKNNNVEIATATGTVHVVTPELGVMWVDDGWSAKPSGTPVSVGDGGTAVIGANAFGSVAAAVKAAQDGTTINVYPGEYGLTADPTWDVAGQGGWYLPIVQDNLTLQGVDATGKPISSKPDENTALPLIYGADKTANGAWASQDLIAVFGDNVTIQGLHFMPKVEENKTIELIGANPTVRYNLFTPNSKTPGSDTGYGGSLYVNGAGIGDGTSNAILADNYFVKTSVVFDSVQYLGENVISGNTFDTPWSYEDGGSTKYGYMIGNVTWASPAVTQFTGALVENNTFLNYPPNTDSGFALIKNRLNGRFTLRNNRTGGTDGADLIQIDTGRYGAMNGSVLVQSYVDSSGQTVGTYTLVDKDGTHRANLLLAADGPDTVVAREQNEFSVRLQNTGGTAMNDALVNFTISGASAAEDVSILYPKGDEWLPLSTTYEGGQIKGYFGPSSGFPVSAGYDVTTTFRVTFQKAGTYTANFSAISVGAPSVSLASAAHNVTVNTAPSSPSQGGGGGGTPPTQPPVVAGSESKEVKSDEGGTVETGDGRLTIEVPAGAQDQDFTITVAPVTDTTEMPHEGMFKVGNQVVEIVAQDAAGNSVTSFKKELTLTFKFESTDLAEGVQPEDLMVFYWNADLQAWIAVPSEVDTTKGEVTARVNHFTTFALMAAKDFPRLTDIKGHWAEADILALISAKVVNGAGNNQYLPEGQVTRAQFAKMIVGAMGYTPTANPQLAFDDASSIPDWAKGYVATAVEKGIITGLPGNRFGGEEFITREQMAVMIARALKLTSAGETTFTDNGSISAWARPSVKAAVEKGIISGVGGNLFAPGDRATRAQAAKMLSVLLRLRFEQ